MGQGLREIWRGGLLIANVIYVIAGNMVWAIECDDPMHCLVEVGWVKSMARLEHKCKQPQINLSW